VLSPVDIRRHLASIRDRDIPLDFLPTFLHETTHHWCFTSPVGFASLLLFFRARRIAIRGLSRAGPLRRDRVYEVLDAVLRYEFAHGLMRPLAEGIALFAEHDACIGFTDSISRPMAFAGSLFAQGFAARTDPPWAKVPLLLAGGRLTSSHIRRKADLLMQPFSCISGGYLPGYLMVKALWVQNFVNLRCSHFADTDFYLQFIRSFFYDDWELVACLLDDGYKDIGALDPIGRRIQKRLIAFAREENRQKVAEQFERQSVSGLARVDLKAELSELSLSYNDFGVPGDSAAIGKQRLEVLYRELFDAWPDDEYEQALIELDIDTLRFWSTITLGRGNLGARATERNLEFIDERDVLFSTKLPPGLQSNWSGKLDVDIVFDTTAVGMFGFVSGNETLIDTWQLSNSDVPEHLKSARVHSRSRAELMQMSQNFLSRALADEDLDFLRGNMHEDINGMTDAIYLDRANPGTHENFKEIRSKMEVDGLLPLLDHDLRLLADAAAASLCAPLNHKLESVRPFHSWTRDDPYDAVAAIDTILKKHLRPPIFPMNGRNILPGLI
jgi:hypothetical protein